MRKSSNCPSLGRIELKDWKLKKNSLWCVALWIFTGVKEQSNTGLWMVIATPNFSMRWHIEGESLILFTKLKWMVIFADAASVKNAIVQFYDHLYHEDQPFRSFLGGIAFNSISLEGARDLIKEFTEDEVWKAIIDLGK